MKYSRSFCELTRKLIKMFFKSKHVNFFIPISGYQQIASSVTGALMTSIFMTPLDVVKTRLQVQDKLLLSNKCYLYCNGLMDHLCPCGPTQGQAQAVQKFNGTIVSTYIIHPSASLLNTF